MSNIPQFFNQSFPTSYNQFTLLHKFPGCLQDRIELCLQEFKLQQMNYTPLAKLLARFVIFQIK